LPQKIAALSEIALFAALSESEIQGLAQRAVERRFAPDEMLFCVIDHLKSSFSELRPE
jgi:hypothetical protein